MKGHYVQGPLIWEIETKGESWVQGALVQGRMTVKNQGPGPETVRPGVALAVGDFRGVHAKNEKSLKREQENLESQDIGLAPGETRTIEFSFPLPPNSHVSDKKGSYYLTYGQQALGQSLQMAVAPRPLFMKIVELMANFQRFKLKDFKSVKQGVEFRFIPPEVRGLATVESLVLTMSVRDQDLVLDFLFNTRRLNLALPTSAPTEKEIKEVQKRLTPKEYLMGKDMLNQDVLLKVLNEVVAQVHMRAIV